MSAWWLAWQEGFAGFAWPWAWAALPLPLLAWLLLPPRQSSAAALRVPWRRRLDQVAAGGDAGVRGAWLLPLLAWVLLCAATARPQQLGPAQVPPQEARQMLLAVRRRWSMFGWGYLSVRYCCLVRSCSNMFLKQHWHRLC